MCCTWFAHELRPGHLSARVGDSSQRNEEIVKNLNAPFSVIAIIIIIIVIEMFGVAISDWLEFLLCVLSLDFCVKVALFKLESPLFGVCQVLSGFQLDSICCSSNSSAFLADSLCLQFFWIEQRHCVRVCVCVCVWERERERVYV